jgi:hypothetical protein
MTRENKAVAKHMHLIFSYVSIGPLTTKDKAICCQSESRYDTESEMTRMHITYKYKEEKIRTRA